MTNPLPIRESARLVVLNERDEVFLFRHEDPPSHPDPRRYWVTPGGGVDPGETWEMAALRELREETGIEGVPLGPWVWSRESETLHAGAWIRLVERYYLVRVVNATIDVANQLAYEREVYRTWRWWPLERLRVPPEVIYPEQLAGLVAPLLEGRIPEVPILLPA